ncbi:MAG: DUF1501 domain-containing protein [Verrucomicrobiota bacterium]
MNSTRRHFLSRNALGISSLALANLLKDDGLFAAPFKPVLEQKSFDMLPKDPQQEPRAKAMISMFMGGGPSHLELLDPKPMLDKYAGKDFPNAKELKFDSVGQASAVLMPSAYAFEKCGQSGTEVSELLPHFKTIVDDATVIRSMTLPDIRNHVAGMRALTTGRGQAGWPSLGSWLTYGLGSETNNLPSFVALIVGSNPPGSPFWDSRHLPSIYQGTVVREQSPRIMNLTPPAHLKGAAQEKQLSSLAKLNQLHLKDHPGENDLSARIASYELAARMQTSATDALDLSKETAATRKLYGLEDKNTKKLAEACIIARRLVERGVRFVQIWNYAWDMHENLTASIKTRCAAVDQPCAALVKDLKSRGMLDSTIVQWGGEMGRLPVIQDRGAGKKPGRDHNTEGFSIWMAGGGIKGGHVHGATDEFGHRAVDQPVNQHDFHATILKQFGLDANQLSYRQNALPVALVEMEKGKAVEGILA